MEIKAFEDIMKSDSAIPNLKKNIKVEHQWRLGITLKYYQVEKKTWEHISEKIQDLWKDTQIDLDKEENL
jgi:hypothetical protein